jgi:hypothetical protein
MKLIEAEKQRQKYMRKRGGRKKRKGNKKPNKKGRKGS